MDKEKFFKFIKRRLDWKKFSGLLATALFFAFIYLFFLLAGIIEDVLTNDVIVSVDAHMTNLVAFFRSPELTNFFLGVTLLGKWYIVLVFTFVAVVLLWLWKKRAYILPLLLTLTGSEIFTGLGKIILQRPRPALAVYIEHSFSFPSGHATLAVAFYGFLTYVLVRNVKLWKTKFWLFLSGGIVVLLIGFSRLYLGVHYVSDVWGGYLVGAVWLVIGISLSEWWLLKKTNKSAIE